MEIAAAPGHSKLPWACATQARRNHKSHGSYREESLHSSDRTLRRTTQLHVGDVVEANGCLRITCAGDTMTTSAVLATVAHDQRMP